MKKRILMSLLLMLCLSLLAGCSATTGRMGVSYSVTDSPAAEVVTSQPGTEARAEVVTVEMTAMPVQLAQPQTATAIFTPAPTMASEYAGATPVVIDPIDKPTPTPLPALNFEYTTYDATRLHLAFDAPSGWVIDDSSADVYTLTNPAYGVDYQATMSVTAVSVSSQYTDAQLKTEVNNRLSAKRSGFYSFSPTKPASRTLLDKTGMYADYSATLSNGVQIKGRIHVTCVNKTLYVYELVTPAGYFNNYKDGVYTKFRHTLRITQ